MTPAERYEAAAKAREQARDAVDVAMQERNSADVAYLAAMRAETQAIDELLASSAALRNEGGVSR